MIFDSLTEEQLEQLMQYMEDKFLPEPPNTVHSLAELEEKLAEAEEDIKASRVVTEEEMNAFFKEHFGI